MAPGDPLSRPTVAGIGPFRIAWSLGCLLAIVLAALFDWQVRSFEAGVSAAVLRAAGDASAHARRATVLYLIDGQLTGHSITVGCTTLLLLVPFFLVASVLFTVRRVPVSVTARSLAIAAAAVFVVNQCRMGAIAWSLHLWGVERGYSLSHILVGSVISIVGVVAATMLSLRSLLASPSLRGAGGADGDG